MGKVAVPFAGQSYADKTLNANAQRSINFYPTRSPTPQDPNRIVLYPTPGYGGGTSGGADTRFGNCRGIFVINNTFYFISGSAFALLNPNSSFTVLGTLKTSSGRCSMACNTVDITMSDGTYGYVYNLTTGAFTVISTSGGFPVGGVTNLTYQDGYYLAAVKNSRTVIQSNNLDGTTWQALAFDTPTTFPDNAVGVFSDQNQLYVFGPKVTEVQFDAGTIPYAFQKVSGVLIQAGCAAIETVVKVGTTVIWLANDLAGSPYVAALLGYNPKPVSTPPINEVFASYIRAGLTISDAFAYTYREGDNQFYVITFPSVNNGLGATWAYDVKMDMWHERSVANVNTGAFTAGGRDLPNFCVFWQNRHYVDGNPSAAANFRFYEMSQDYTNDPYLISPASSPALIRVRTCQHVVAGGSTVFIPELHIDMETGTTSATGSAQGSNPLATLEMSRDGGHTWLDVGTRSLGSQGQYLKRLVWRKLGRARTTLTFRLTVTDPVRTFILGAWAIINAGTK